MPATVIPLYADARPAIDGQLALPLEWEVAPGIPAVPPAPRHLRLVGSSPDAVAAEPPMPRPEPAWWRAWPVPFPRWGRATGRPAS